MEDTPPPPHHHPRPYGTVRVAEERERENEKVELVRFTSRFIRIQSVARDPPGTRAIFIHSHYILIGYKILRMRKRGCAYSRTELRRAGFEREHTVYGQRTLLNRILQRVVVTRRIISIASLRDPRGRRARESLTMREISRKMCVRASLSRRVREQKIVEND